MAKTNHTPEETDTRALERALVELRSLMGKPLRFTNPSQRRPRPVAKTNHTPEVGDCGLPFDARCALFVPSGPGCWKHMAEAYLAGQRLKDLDIAQYRSRLLAAEAERDEARRIVEEADAQRAAAEGEVERLHTQIEQRMGACYVCFHESWEPVPADDPDAEEIIRGPLKGTYARCYTCWATKQLASLRLRNQELVAALEEIARWSQELQDCGCVAIARAALAARSEERKEQG